MTTADSAPEPLDPAEASERAPHDGLFTMIAGELTSGMALIMERLPPALAAAIVPGSLERDSTSFVGPALRRRYADVLFRLRVRTEEGEREAFVYVLLEHKSAPDGRTALQLLVYKTLIWERWLDDGNGMPLPPVMAIVVHQGPPAWTHGTTFGKLFEPVPVAAAPTVPDYTFVLFDLFREPDEALSRQDRLRTGLMVMKYARRPDLADHLADVFRGVVRLTKVEIEEVLTYLERSPVRVAPATIIDALARVVRDGEEDAMGVLEILEERGLAKGLERGRAEGKAEGKAEALRVLLRRRFGPLTVSAEKRLAAASSEQVGRWLDQIFDAADVEDVLKG
jgi:Putative transposase, YhgA-like